MNPRGGRDLHLWAQGNEKEVNEIILLGYLKARMKQAQKASSVLLTWHSQRTSGHLGQAQVNYLYPPASSPQRCMRDRELSWGAAKAPMVPERGWFFRDAFSNCSFISSRLEEDVPWLSFPNQQEASGCINHKSRACEVFCDHLRKELLSQCGKTPLKEEERSSMRLTPPTRILIGP